MGSESNLRLTGQFLYREGTLTLFHPLFHPDVVHGKRPINAELALRLARFFGTDAQSWVSLQTPYDLERAKIELAARVKKEVKPHTA